MSETGLRWGAVAPSTVDAARERLLDAAEHCFTRAGISSTTVEHIADEAKVSRATVYRYFSGRDELVLGVVLREADRFLARARSRVDSQTSLEDALLEFMMATVTAARRDEMLAILFTVDEAQAAGQMMVGGSVALFERTADFLRPVFTRFADQVRPGVEVDDAAEWMLRVILSMLTVRGPRRRSRERWRQYLRTYVVSAISTT
jgi:AcrR family transcriptional regulator